MKVFIGGLLGAIALVFGLSYLGYLGDAFFAPRYEAIRRETTIESRAYSEATVRELYRLKMEYEQTQDVNARATIVAAARHEFEIFPQDRLPADLRAWMQIIINN